MVHPVALRSFTSRVSSIGTSFLDLRAFAMLTYIDTTPYISGPPTKGVTELYAIARVPPAGRLLEVVYKKLARDKIKLITAYWLD